MRNGKVSAAVIGAAGNQALHFLGMCRDVEWVDLVAVIEHYDREEAGKRALEYGASVCLTLGTVDELVAAVRGGLDLDLAIVVSRPDSHAQAVIAMLGIDVVVLCEKPPTLTLGEMLAIRDAELASKAWVAWNFQLEEQWSVMREAYEAGWFGSEIMTLLTRWVRGYIAPQDLARAGERTRRGQAGSPMFDLSHMLHAGVCFVPGIQILRVLGSSKTVVFDVAGIELEQIYDTLTATCRLPGARRDEFQLRVEVGWNVPLPGEADLEEVYVDIQGSGGSGKLNLMVGDEPTLGAPRVRKFYWPSITSVDATGRQWDSYGKSPQPHSVAECYRRIFDRVIAAIRSGEPMANGAGTGLTVMEALAGWELSCRLRREVTIGEIHSEAA